jgi:hypothetical protein
VRNRNTNQTHEGGPALPTATPARELRRAVSSCLLWEDNFYESGVEIAERIKDLVAKCPPQFVADLAVEAREQMRLRHAPLWLLAALMTPDRKAVTGIDAAVARVIKRADEPGELISLFRKAWPDSKAKIPAAFKRGIAEAFRKFDAYQLGKYNRKAAYSLRDVLRLTAPKPRDAEQSAMWKQVIAGTLPSPDTWEVALSAGADKKATFERLIGEGRLGGLALLRNLRLMDGEGVNPDVIRAALQARKGFQNVLPFRYVAAAKAAPRYEPYLDEALLASIDEMPSLPGETIVLVDVSPSMAAQLSGKSDMTRMTAAATLASIIPGKVRVLTFDTDVREVAPRRGMAGVETILRIRGNSTMLGKAVTYANTLPHDRLIVITDEETFDVVPAPKAKRAYMINVVGGRNEVGYGSWTRISGFSENVLRFIAANETEVVA